MNQFSTEDREHYQFLIKLLVLAALSESIAFDMPSSLSVGVNEELQLLEGEISPQQRVYR